MILYVQVLLIHWSPKQYFYRPNHIQNQGGFVETKKKEAWSVKKFWAIEIGGALVIAAILAITLKL